jgi:hypothetical protein
VGDRAATPAAKRDDVIGRVVSWDAEKVILEFDPVDETKQQYPAESRVYLLPVGYPAPATPDDWIGYGLSFGVSNAPIDPVTGAGEYAIAMPSAPPGDYLAQVVHGFEV